MTYFQYKEANRFYWMVKGQLIPESWSDKDIIKTYDSYMTRLWGNCERAEYSTLGFEAAWAQRQAKKVKNNLTSTVK
jgi:hypothetical protein